MVDSPGFNVKLARRQFGSRIEGYLNMSHTSTTSVATTLSGYLSGLPFNLVICVCRQYDQEP